ncbi:MAG TPA: hypothetical protein VIO58_04925 [Candidatus Methanoperedens sp.]
MKTQCPLCGARFDPGDNMGCMACPRFMKCGLVLCPNCGYEFPEIKLKSNNDSKQKKPEKTLDMII